MRAASWFLPSVSTVLSCVRSLYSSALHEWLLTVALGASAELSIALFICILLSGSEVPESKVRSFCRAIAFARFSFFLMNAHFLQSMIILRRGIAAAVCKRGAMNAGLLKTFYGAVRAGDICTLMLHSHIAAIC